MNNGGHSLIIFLNLSPCPKNQKGRKSGNHCQDWYFPTGYWHKRQVRSSGGIHRSRRLEINPLTNSDGLFFGIINTRGPSLKGSDRYALSPLLWPPFSSSTIPRSFISGLWPFCSFFLDYSFPNLSMTASWSFMSQPKYSVLGKAFPDPLM